MRKVRISPSVAALLVFLAPIAAKADVRSTVTPPSGDPEVLCIQSNGAIGIDTEVATTCDDDAQIVEIGGLTFGSTGQTSINGSTGAITVGGALNVNNGVTVNMGGNTVTGVGDPGADTTAAVNKGYVDGANATQNARITDVENDVADNTADIAENTSDIAQNTSDIAQNTSDIAQNTSDIAQNTVDIASNTTAIAGLQNTTSNLQSQIDDLAGRDDELAEGIAIALALEQPVLLSGQTFALRVGYGNFDGDSAMGVTAVGVVSRNQGTSVTLDGGVGVGAQEGTVAGRGGVTFGW